MKKMVEMLLVSILCISCPDFNQDTLLTEFDICTTVKSVNIDSGKYNATAIILVNNNGITRNIQVLAELNLAVEGRACGGKFIGENAEIRVMTIAQVSSIRLINKDGKLVFGSASLPSNEKIIEASFKGFFKDPKDPENGPMGILKNYLDGFNQLAKREKENNPNDSHLIKESEMMNLKKSEQKSEARI